MGYNNREHGDGVRARSQAREDVPRAEAELTAEEAAAIMEDAKAVAEAGAFAMVIEGTVEPVARQITAEVPIPTIGIGASPPVMARSW